jgi:uridine phosphorylase
MMAVAEYRGVTLGQIFYAGHDLSGGQWDSRGWISRKEVRENLFWLAAESYLEL